MITNNSSLKEYYSKLSSMYENAVNMLTAINQSLSTTASEISVKIANGDETTDTIRIPSFLYLENKLEQLDMNMDNLWKIPESGEAWFENNSNMYKLKLVRSNTAPIQPTISSSDLSANMEDSSILKDLVSPKMFIRMQIDNIPENVEHMLMKKVVIYNPDIFNSLTNLGIHTYNEYTAALYNLKKGSDYDEYESLLDMPIKKDTYESRFEIVDLPKNDADDNPKAVDGKLTYKVVLNTLEYHNQEDSSISYKLHVGDFVCLGNELCIYKIKDVNTSEMSVSLEEYVGHIALQKFSENNAMVLQIYNSSYAEYHYIDIPLEENPYVIVFLATVYNNVRSLYSDAHVLNLNAIYVKDLGGNFVLDSNGNKLTYLEYYDKYCKNIGDLILGLTETAYPQFSNFPADVLETLQNDVAVADVMNSSVIENETLQVVAINKHLADDGTNEDIKKLHAQKNDLNAQLETIQTNIDDTYTTLISTDFSQNVTVSQSSLQSKIQEYYSERTETQKQLNNIIDNINAKATELNISTKSVKYRVRGMIDYSTVEAYVKNIAGEKCDIIGIDVEYKYKSTTKDTTQLTTIGGNTFTDWNKLGNIDRQRKLTFTATGYGVEFVDYGLTDNIVKWNQIDIPITNGEDVIIRFRYKFNIGQPFVNLYSPWSNEWTIPFPTEFAEDIQINNILEQNNQDTINSTFSKTLINDGYTEHIQNKVINNAQVFFHDAGNIYSGFNTSENNLISLKDKLTAMVSDIEKYKAFIEQQTNAKFEVYLNYDSNQILLAPNAINKINIYNTDHITDMFIKKNMNIVIKNVGDTTINLYSIFPGDNNTLLLKTDNEFYNEYIVNYERVPVFFNNTLDGQYLGQWIYFRSNNPYTKEDIYFNSNRQNVIDFVNQENNELMHFSYAPEYYMPENNKQVLLAYKRRASIEHNLESIYQNASEYMEDARQNASYFDVLPAQETLNKIYSIHPPKGSSLLFETTYTDAKADSYNYFCYATLNDIQYDSLDCTLISSEGDKVKPKTINEVFYHKDGDTLAYNTVTSVIISYNGAEYYKHDATTYADDNWDDTAVKYTLQSDSDIMDLDQAYYVNKMIDADIEALSKSNINYSYDYIYPEHYTQTDEHPYGVKETNKYLVKYEDIIGVQTTGKKTQFTLDATTSLTKFISQYNVALFKDVNESTEKFNGAFLYPDLSNKAQITIENSVTDSKQILAGESLNIPIVFEYYIDGNSLKQITKSLYFDLRNSLISNPLHFMIEIIGNYDYTTTGNIYSDIDDIDIK